MTTSHGVAFTELRPREKIAAVLDPGAFRELLGPAQRVESPHLPLQGIVPQTDDGAVIARGEIDGVEAVVAAVDGAFQGGGIGEISGAKIAAALERALRDRHAGIPVRVVLILETGGIRLQEANLGLLAVADIHAAISALRATGPVVGIVCGGVGCFGGMAIAAGLTSHLVLAPGARVGLNGPEVIETEAGIDELDATDRRLVWSMIGGIQRVATHAAELLVADDTERISETLRDVWCRPDHDATARSLRVDEAAAILGRLDPASRPTPDQYRALVQQATG